MNFTRSPFAPDHFPDLPAVKGVQAATASRGFYRAAGLDRDDVFLMVFDPGTACAGVFTQSSTASDDVRLCRAHLKSGGGAAQALLVNSGNSNAFTGPLGRKKNDASVKALTQRLGMPAEACFVAATGVIGEPLPDPNYVGLTVPDMADRLTAPDWEALAKAFMTTDTYAKGAGTTLNLDGKPISIAGIAKGSGMIAPNMSTMLAYEVTDAAVAPDILQRILARITETTFNAITVDSDTSTSDTFMVFATGASGMTPIEDENDPRLPALETALHAVSSDLAGQIVKDGEGISRLITITVSGAQHDADAKMITASVANSPLVKTALAAGDANWGRVVMAAGKAGVDFDQTRLEIWFGDHHVATAGARHPEYDEARASAICAEREIVIRIQVGDGTGEFTIQTCDLTHAYIDINGAYRT